MNEHQIDVAGTITKDGRTVAQVYHHKETGRRWASLVEWNGLGNFGRYDDVGEQFDTQRLVNQHGGADKIVAKLREINGY